MRISPVALLFVTLLHCGSDSRSTKTTASANASDAAPTSDTAAPDTQETAPPHGPICTVTHAGTSGVALSGTLLLPNGPMTGEVFADST